MYFIIIVFISISSTVLVFAQNIGLQTQPRHLRQQQQRQLQWGSRYPNFSSLLSAADYTTASLSQGNTFVAISSEGTRSVMNLQDGDWLRYSLGIPESGLYLLSMRVAIPDDVSGSFRILLVDSDTELAAFSDLIAPDNDGEWTTLSTNISLPVGLHLLEIQVQQGGWSLQWMNLLPVNLVDDVPQPVSMTATPTATPVISSAVTLSPVVAPVTDMMPPIFAPIATPIASPVATPIMAPVTAPTMVPVVSTTRTPTVAPVTTPVSAAPITPVLTPTVEPSTLEPAPFEIPVSIPVETPIMGSPANIPTPLPPALTSNDCLLLIQAPEYVSMMGIGYEEGTDYVGWLDPGDWIIYNVALPPGEYQVDIAVASPEGMGSFFFVESMTQTPLMRVDNLPATGDWNTWQTVNTVFEIPAMISSDSFPMELKIESGNWNLRSMCFREATTTVQPVPVPVSLPTEVPVISSFSSAPSESPVRPPHDCSSPF